MENADVALCLSEMADMLELGGGNAFKVRAYRQAAQVVDTLPAPVADLWRAGTLTALPGIGARIAAHIGELVETGRFRDHDALAARVPPGVVEMLRLEGVGPKTAAAAWKGLGVVDLAGLEAACRDGRLAGLPRLGEARVRHILDALARHRARAGRTPLHRALAHADTILMALRAVRGVTAAEAAGSLRRRRDTVGDIDLLVAAPDAEPVVRALLRLPDVESAMAEGPTKAAVRLRGGLQVDVRVVPAACFGAALHYFTGSKGHNIALRARAQRMGFKLSEYGLFDRHDRLVAGATEADVFHALGLPFIPPELREGAGEIEAADRGALPHLVEEDDLQGDLHVHSTASSDGRSTLAELADEARRLGRRYLAITDHSRSRPLGLDAAALARQAAAVRAEDRARHGRPRLLTGVEVDILPDGELDLPHEALAGLDWVVASVHAHFGDPSARMTERLVRAIGSGVVHAIGHPSGRQIGVRDAYAFDLGRVLDAAREAGVALEVNAQPDRLDLTDQACRAARAAGVRVAIASDAHHAGQLGNLRYGVWVARRGWLEKKDVVNTAGAEGLPRRPGPRARPTGRAAPPAPARPRRRAATPAPARPRRRAATPAPAASPGARRPSPRAARVRR